MSNVYDRQLNLCAETTYGTYASSGVRSIEFDSMELNPKHERVTSMGHRAARYGVGERNILPTNMGAEGKLKLTPQTKGFGLLLSHALGSTSVGTVVSAKYLQTHTVAPLAGKSLSVQFARPYVGPATTMQTITGLGGKITDWTLSCNVGGLVEFEAGLDFQSYGTGTALAAAAYPTGTEPFVWSSATVTIGGVSFAVEGVEIKGDNGLKTDRHKMAAATKTESTESADKKITGKLKGIDWASSTLWDYIVSSTNSGLMAAIVVTFTGQTDTANALTLTMSKCAIDPTGFPTISGDNVFLQQDIDFTATWPDAGGSPLTATYNSTDSAA